MSTFSSNCLSVFQQLLHSLTSKSFLPSLFVPRMLRAVRCPPTAFLRAGVEGGCGGGGGEGGRAGGRGGEVQHPRHEGCLLPLDQNGQCKKESTSVHTYLGAIPGTLPMTSGVQPFA